MFIFYGRDSWPNNTVLLDYAEKFIANDDRIGIVIRKHYNKDTESPFGYYR